MKRWALPLGLLGMLLSGCVVDPGPDHPVPRPKKVSVWRRTVNEDAAWFRGSPRRYRGVASLTRRTISSTWASKVRWVVSTSTAQSDAKISLILPWTTASNASSSQSKQRAGPRKVSPNFPFKLPWTTL